LTVPCSIMGAGEVEGEVVQCASVAMLGETRVDLEESETEDIDDANHRGDATAIGRLSVSQREVKESEAMAGAASRCGS